jgi:hypothetical protein
MDPPFDFVLKGLLVVLLSLLFYVVGVFININ